MPAVSSCSRCGYELTGPGSTCSRCGASQAEPAWTQPVAAAGATIQSKAVAGGGLNPGKKYALIMLQGEEPGRVIPIEKSRITLGRADCDISLKDPELSRQHALISIHGMSARLEDLGSTNGTFVDGERVDNAELSDRSEFRIGLHEFVFVMRDQDVE
ncbi:MAG TPA: FHA domain-containing protein [Vicinamibacteria bacterium]